MERAREFAELHKTQYLYMMYVWGHSYEFTADDNWELIEEFCRFIGGREDIWYAATTYRDRGLHAGRHGT